MKNYPFVVCSISFMVGILINDFAEINSVYLLVLLLLSILLLLISIQFKETQFRGLFIIALNLLFLVLGSYIHQHQIENKKYLSTELKMIEDIIVIGSVTSVDLPKENVLTFEVRSDSIRIGSVYQIEQVNLLCRLKDDDFGLKKLFNKLLPGNEVRIEGTFQRGREDRNPGEFNYHNYLHTKGISGLLYTDDDYKVKIINWNYELVPAAIFKIRKFIESQISSMYNKQSSGLLRGLLLADRSGIDYETKTEFVNSGVMHILAVSGLHVGYIILIFIFAFGRFNVLTKSILTILGLIFFLFLTGTTSSVFRAVVMAAVVIIAYISNRSTSIYNSLAAAAFVVLIFNPGELFNPGFQLSFLAVLSIAVIYPIIQKYVTALKIKSKALSYVLLFMAVSFSAQIGTLPLTMIYFGKLSIVSLFTNLFVIPLVGVIVGISIFTLFIGILIPSVAAIFASANDFLINILFKTISYAGSDEYSFVYIRNFSAFDSIIFYAAIIFILVGIYKFRNLRAKVIFIILIIANSVLLSSVDNKKLLDDGKLSLMLLDVNRGNASLIKFPNGQIALINGGNASFYFDNGERIIKPLLTNLGIEKVDYAFISEMKIESFGGLISLIKNGSVEKVFKPEIDSHSFLDLSFKEFLLQNKISQKYFYNTALQIGDAKIFFLNTDRTHVNSIKDDSPILMKIVYGNTSLLFTNYVNPSFGADFSNRFQKLLNSDVLIVSNAGGRNKISTKLLELVSPKIILISSSNQNKFDNSTSVNTSNLKKQQQNVFSTSEEGAVLLQSDGQIIKRIKWK